jgi:hypothetical protein
MHNRRADSSPRPNDDSYRTQGRDQARGRTLERRARSFRSNPLSPDETVRPGLTPILRRPLVLRTGRPVIVNSINPRRVGRIQRHDRTFKAAAELSSLRPAGSSGQSSRDVQVVPNPAREAMQPSKLRSARPSNLALSSVRRPLRARSNLISRKQPRSLSDRNKLINRNQRLEARLPRKGPPAE